MAGAGNLENENLVFDGTGYQVNGEIDLQRVVTQEELVKRDTPPGAMREGGVHCCSSALERANVADRAGASPGDCPLQGCPRFLGFLPHVVSDNFSKLGKLLEAGRPPPLCPPVRTAGVQPAQRAGAEAKAAGCCLHFGDVDSFSACFLPCRSPIDHHRLVSDVLDGRCTLHARLSTNSCVIGAWEFTTYGTRLIHVWGCMLIHGGAIAHGNSRMERGREVSGETKTLSTSTLSRVWRPAVGENLPLQQALESLHEEAWVGCVNSFQPEDFPERGNQ